MLRECLHDLMTDGTKKILSIINKNLSTFIRLYCNKQMLDQHLSPETANEKLALNNLEKHISKDDFEQRTFASKAARGSAIT